MSGPETAALTAILITLTAAVVVGLDWWGRRKDRCSGSEPTAEPVARK